MIKGEHACVRQDTNARKRMILSLLAFKRQFGRQQHQVITSGVNAVFVGTKKRRVEHF